MASKEHTNNLVKAGDPNVELRKSLQSDLNTYGTHSNSNKERDEPISGSNSVKGDEHCFKAGTFAAEPAIISVEQIDEMAYDGG